LPADQISHREMNDPVGIRLLIDRPFDGPTNMGRDEALMACVGAGESPPTLRLYRWDPPTISLGYFQHYADYEALPPPAGRLAVVRRPTGGGAILHDLELTYSLTLPVGHALLSRGPNRLYEIAHDAVIAALGAAGLSTQRCGVTDDSGAARGPFFCFERRHCYDVLLGDGKIAGSAQRRTRQALLQHGSIILGNRFAQQPTARPVGDFDSLVALVRDRFVEAFAAASGVRLEPGEWSEMELRMSQQLLIKYAGAEWTRRA
jgi:lipoate-protein ligase A